MWWQNRRLKVWQGILEQCKLTDTERTGFWAWRPMLQVRAGAFNLWLTHPSGEPDHVLVVIEGAPGFSRVRLRRQLLKLWTQEIEVGDEGFDDKFLVDGPPGFVYALLDTAMRRLLVRAHAACNPLEIGDGRLLAKISEKDLLRTVPLLLEISRQLAEPLDVKAQLLRNACRDPQPGVRLANLRHLVREYPTDPETPQALRRASTDADPQVRLRAAIELGDEGRDVLLALAETSPDDASGAQAVQHLGGKLPLEAAKAILARALRKGYSQTARACLELLGKRRAVAIGTLVRVMTTRKDELAAAAALALGATGEEAAQPPLLEALRSSDSDLREAAATSLGQVGTADAVQPLKDATERYWLQLGLRRAARQAIAEIHARLGATPGQLSLADAEAGQLSLAQDAAGQLSLTNAEPAPGLPERGPECGKSA